MRRAVVGNSECNARIRFLSPLAPSLMLEYPTDNYCLPLFRLCLFSERPMKIEMVLDPSRAPTASLVSRVAPAPANNAPNGAAPKYVHVKHVWIPSDTLAGVLVVVTVNAVHAARRHRRYLRLLQT